MISLLVRASLEGAVLAACVWAACRALPRMSPGVRTLLWWCVAAKFVVALVWITPVRLPVLPRATADVPHAAAVQSPSGAGATTVSASPAGSAEFPSPASGTRRVPWTALLIGAWMTGLGISLARTLRDWRRTRGVIGRSIPAGDALHAMVRDLSARVATRGAVDVRVSAEVESPLIVGVRRPVILVPAGGFAALSPDHQRMALCHELAHLRRGDLWLGCIPALAERCFFFHPLARLAAREYAFWREAACDEAVITTLNTSPRGYGLMLLSLGVSRRTAAFSAAGAAWSFQNLKRRITMLEHTSTSSFRGRAIAAGAVAAAILAVAPVRAVARAAAPVQTRATVPVQAAQTVPSRPGAPVPAPVPAAVPALSPETPSVPSPTPETDAQQEPDLPFVLLRGDGNTMMAGNSDDVARVRRYRRGNEPLLWFRYDGREYIVRDAGVLREAEEVWGPVGRIGEQQGRIGEQQGRIGEAQGRIGAAQGRVGERQGRLGEQTAAISMRLVALSAREAGDISDADRRAIRRDRDELRDELRRLEEQMEALNEEMREIGAPMEDRNDEMEALAEQMHGLSGQMEAAVERANTEMVSLVRRAIASGAAESIR